jgi:alkanesulfonate monooxygenase SsuD/methylene tetrahydromethanopterin reductase-like flavin-dependent oxidoreductase (luciferase family)
MAKTEKELDEDLRDQERKRDTPYMRYLNRQPPNIVGTPEVIAEKIREYYPLGVDHFILRFHFGDELESMNLFVDQVKKLL